jgi:hypothetical protein
VKRRTSRKSSSLDISSHSLLRRTSVRSGSSTVNACSWNVRAWASISSSLSTGRSTARPLGSPTLPV